MRKPVTFWDGKWRRIGYVVSEALKDVHLAMNNTQIINVCFDWVKFRINWIRSGIGYYAAINIMKQGKWSSNVCKYPIVCHSQFCSIHDALYFVLAIRILGLNSM